MLKIKLFSMKMHQAILVISAATYKLIEPQLASSHIPCLSRRKVSSFNTKDPTKSSFVTKQDEI